MKLQTQITSLAIAMLIMSISIFVVASQGMLRYKQQTSQFKSINEFQKNQQKFNKQVVENLKQQTKNIGDIVDIVTHK